MHHRLPHVIAAALTLLPLLSCAGDWELRVQNSTGANLEYCPVVPDPPPPHRECTRELLDGETAEIDTEDFNPVLWDPVSMLGIYVQMALGDDPPMIQVRVAELKVPPGQEGNDPANQPTILASYPFEGDPDETKEILVRAGPTANQIPISITQ